MLCGTCKSELPIEENLTERYVTCTQCGTKTDTAQQHLGLGTGASELPDMPPEIIVDLTGRQLGRGTYLVEEKIGEGGMGQVYRGRHLRLDQEVAIKVISPRHANREDFIARFHREGQTLGKIRHEGVVRVLDSNREDDLHYMVMEFVRGPDGNPTSLRDLIWNGPLEPSHAMTVIEQACDALGAIHEMGIVHRDVKPGNFLINEQGRTLVADFGIATSASATGGHTYTQTGMTLGDLTYMSPEQKTNAKGVDERTDIYSLGLTFYELLAGEVPQGHFEAPSVARKGVPKKLDEIVLKALKQQPEARYASMREFKEAIQAARTKVGGGGSFSMRKAAMATAALVFVGCIAFFAIANEETKRDVLTQLGLSITEEAAADEDGGTIEESAAAVDVGKPRTVLIPADEPLAEGATETPPLSIDPKDFRIAVAGGDAAAVQSMLETDPSLAVAKWPDATPALHTAVSKGHGLVLDVLLSFVKEVDMPEPELDRTALHVATAYGDPEMVDSLRFSNANVNAKDRNLVTPLHLASALPDVQIAELLLESGADLGVRDVDGESPLHIASRNENAEIVTVLLESGANHRVQDLKGDAPLHVATREQQRDAIEVLFASKANHLAENFAGETPLSVAKAQGMDDIVLLFEPPPPVDPKPVVIVKPPVSEFPLHDAVSDGTLDNIRKLIQTPGVDVNKARPSDGNTPLHLAAIRGDAAVVQLLLDNGAGTSKNTRNKLGDYPWNTANRSNNEHLVDVLQGRAPTQGGSSWQKSN